MTGLTRQEAATLRQLKAKERTARKAERADKRQRLALRTPDRDRGRERDPGFLAYLRRQPCEAAGMGGCSGPIQSAHIRYSDAAAGARNPGMQRKNHDRHANPLCEWHHIHDQHVRRERDFWSALGKDAYATAAGHYERYRALEGVEG